MSTPKAPLGQLNHTWENVQALQLHDPVVRNAFQRQRVLGWSDDELKIALILMLAAAKKASETAHLQHLRICSGTMYAP